MLVKNARSENNLNQKHDAKLEKQNFKFMSEIEKRHKMALKSNGKMAGEQKPLTMNTNHDDPIILKFTGGSIK